MEWRWDGIGFGWNKVGIGRHWLDWGRAAMGWAADCRVQGWDGMGLVGWYRALWDWMG